MRSPLSAEIFTTICRLDRTVLRDRAFATLALLTFVALRLVVLFDRCAYASSTSSDYSSTHFETHAFIALMLCTLGIYASVYRHQEERRSLMHSFAGTPLVFILWSALTFQIGVRSRRLFSTLPWQQRVVSVFHLLRFWDATNSVRQVGVLCYVVRVKPFCVCIVCLFRTGLWRCICILGSFSRTLPSCSPSGQFK
jgi:hypothetical protein